MKRDAEEEGRCYIFVECTVLFYQFIYESFSSIFIATYQCINSNFYNGRLAINHNSMTHVYTHRNGLHLFCCLSSFPTKLSTAWPGTNGYLFCANMACILLFVIYLYRKNKRILLKVNY